jgi:hypothetical protein
MWGQGLNIQRQHAARRVGLFRALRLMRRDVAFAAPAFSSSMRDADGAVPFAALHDINQFPYLYEEAPPGPARCAQMPFEAAFGPAVPGDGDACVVANATLAEVEGVAGRFYKPPALEAFAVDALRRMLTSPSPQLKASADPIVRALRAGRGCFACLHLRVEPDFERMFKGPPAYYPADAIARKIGAHHARAASFRGCSTLFIAGNHAPKARKVFEGLGIWSRVATKGDFLDFTPSGAPLTRFAALDFEVCKEADVFIGNNRSAWSELVHDYLLWARHLNRTASVLQVNPPLASGGDEGLAPFCSANHASRHPSVACTYY